MGYLDFLNGINPIIEEAERLYEKGYYKDALEKLCATSTLQDLCISKDQFLHSMYLSAKCYYELNKYNSALEMLDIIINYPDYNHNYISKAEALKKRICRK